MQRIFGVLALVLGLVLALPAVATASNDPFFSQQWGLEAIGAETAWSQGRGAGMIIAIVDTGIDLDHEDLAGKLVNGASFTGASSPQDDNGHGTHVAGIAAASTGNGAGVAGVAPDARILPVQVLNSEGIGSVSDVADGIRFAADNGADVINLSFGEVSTDVDLATDFTDAIRYAWAQGAIPVVAAGNDFVRTSAFTDEPALVVTATGRDDIRPGYASGVGNAQWGMAAPGGDGTVGSDEGCDADRGIVSTYTDDRYACLVGTSMAVPHVAGAAAVLRSMGLSPQQTVDQLLSSADDVGSEGRDATFGAGRLNLAQAVQAGTPATTTTAAPTTTTEAPASIAAAPTTTPAPTTTTQAPTTTTEAPPTTTEAPTFSLPPTTAAPVEPPGGQAIALLPDEGDGTARYVLAVPAALLLAGVGSATWRVRRQLSSP